MSEGKLGRSGGSCPAADVAGPGRIRVRVCPTTGGQIDLSVSQKETVNGLKWLVSRNLRVPPEKITLLYKDRQLHHGSLANNRVLDGSRLTLLPNLESGLSVQKAEVGVIQALENLSDAQVNDFLSGKAPLLLAMRLGDHMMFVQLQLSTAPCVSRRPRPPPLLPPGTAPPPSSASPPPSPPPHTGQTVVSTVTGTSAQGPPLSPTSLSRASRNLSQKLKELSRITSAPPKCSSEEKPSPPTGKDSGAVIESMRHHGKGVYSGTFSGTLDPTLQDQDGKPKRDLSTIIHILNDLLGANRPLQPRHVYSRGPAHSQRCPSPAVKQTKAPRPAVALTTDPSPSYPVGENPGDVEGKALRGKLQRLQAMMEERRLRRRARRDVKAPYHWPMRDVEPATCNMPHLLNSTHNQNKSDAMKPVQEAVGVDVGKEMTENSYNSTPAPMEHETVAV